MDDTIRMPTDAPKPQQYFFMFSSGSYSDYSVGGLYVCNHPVDSAAWNKHYEAYQAQSKVEHDSANIAYGKRVGCGHQEHHMKAGEVITTQPDKGFWGSEECKKMVAWREDNDPETTFIALHNMTQVDVTECWRDN